MIQRNSAEQFYSVFNTFESTEAIENRLLEWVYC